MKGGREKKVRKTEGLVSRGKGGQSLVDWRDDEERERVKGEEERIGRLMYGLVLYW